MTRDTAGDGTPILPIPRLLANDGEQIDRVYGAQPAVEPEAAAPVLAAPLPGPPPGSQPGPPPGSQPGSPPGPHLFGGPVPPPLRHAPARTVPGHTVLPSAPTRRRKGPSLRVDWPACKGHGLCAELLPERFRLDEWRYPIVDPTPVPADLIEVAKRAVASCPTLALRLVDPPG